MKRKIIAIDDTKCNGCGVCVPNCAEGALQIIDGKARLISDLFCDGLGACIGNCPEGAITVEEREAEPYDERKVMENIVKGGANVIKAHLQHMLDHGENLYYREALQYLEEHHIPVPVVGHQHGGEGGCPGSKVMDLGGHSKKPENETTGSLQSELTQWPIQMHLISPGAHYFKGADLLIAADCTAFAAGGFHQDFLKGRKLVIACPKLDSGKETYIDKLISLINDAKVNTITVMMMEVPCCSGLLMLVQEAMKKSTRKVPVKKIIISLHGDLLEEEWV